MATSSTERARRIAHDSVDVGYCWSGHPRCLSRLNHAFKLIRPRGGIRVERTKNPSHLDLSPAKAPLPLGRASRRAASIPACVRFFCLFFYLSVNRPDESPCRVLLACLYQAFRPGIDTPRSFWKLCGRSRTVAAARCRVTSTWMMWGNLHENIYCRTNKLSTRWKCTQS